ncbi:MAG TPA: hypothetical protein VNA20_04430 [Frankiaceae bacterium]|nr:hypothetical protein [Frankiaceae bacterium]
MRKKLALAAAGAALVASFGPAAPANAVCIDWYYELTGQCSPCNTVAYGYNRVDRLAEKFGLGLTDLHCLA